MMNVPDQIGNYAIEEEVARGGMAVVYRAADVRTGRVVALKVLPPHLAHDEQYLKRFLREGRNAVRLDHPHIVHTYEASSAAGYHYLAMQYVDGPTLTEYLRARQTLAPVDEIVRIIAEVARGLDYAHDQGFLHRDIKPSNVLMDKDGRALLSDFGVAKVFDDDLTAVTQLGATVGTPAFMSPEQARGAELDRRSDIYSLGVVAYTMLAGGMPFKADSQPALLHKIVYEAPRPAQELNPDIPPGMLYALDRVLAKDAPMRYPTATAFAEALAEGVTWSPSSGNWRAVSDPGVVAVPVAAAVMPQEPQRRRWLAPVVALALIGLAAAAYFMLRTGGQLPLLTTPPPTANAELLTLRRYEDAHAAFRVDVPATWQEQAQTDGGERTVYFDAPDRIARFFVLALPRDVNDGPENADVDADLAELITAFSVRTDLPYDALTTVQADAPRDRDGAITREAQFAGQWLGRPVHMRLLAMAGETENYLIGLVVEDEQAARFANAYTTMVDGFVITAPVASATTGEDSSVQTRAEAPTGEAQVETGDETDRVALVETDEAGGNEADDASQPTEPTETSTPSPTPPSTAIPTSLSTSTPTDAPTLTPAVADLVSAPFAEGMTDVAAALVAGAVQLSESNVQTATAAAPTVTNTSAPTSTPTPRATSTKTSTPMPTVTATSTRRPPTSTPLPSNTPTSVVTPTRTPTRTPTATETHTRRPPTSTPLPTNTSTSTAPATPTSTPTRKPTSTPLPTNAPTARPATSTPTLTSTSTPTVAPPSTPTAAPATNTPVSVPADNARGAEGLVTGFNPFGAWQIGRQPYGTFQQSAVQSVEGGAAGRLTYQFPAAAGSEDYVVFLAQPRVSNPGSPVSLEMQVYGDGSGNFLNAWVADSASHVWQFTFGQINHSGWASMNAPLDMGAGWPNGVISGGEVSQLTPPLYLHALVVDGVKEGSENGGEIYLDALAVSGSAAVVTAPPSSAPAAPTATIPAGEDSPPLADDGVPSGPVSGRIAYSVLNGSAMNTYVVEAATGTVWKFLPNMRQPDIAGSSLLVNGQGGGKDILFRMGVDGANERTVSKHPEDSHPQWSPSTDSLAYASTHQGDGRWRLYWQVNAKEQAAAPPLAFSGRELFGQYPVYLDNWRIAYQGCNSWAGGSSCGIYTTDTGGGQPNQATTSPDDIPTGNLNAEILFMSKQGGSWDVYAVNWDGSGLRQLTTDGAFDGLATAGPGYQQIAFVSNRDGGWGMYVMNRDGSGQRKLFDLQGGFGDGDFSVVRERISWGP